MRKLYFCSFLLQILILTVIASCKKGDDPGNARVATMNELQVSSSFNWESTRDITLTVGIDMLPAHIGTLSRIAVFDGDPSKGGNILATGAAGYNSPFEIPLRITSTLNTLYLQAEDGSTAMLSDSVAVSDKVNYMFKQSVLKNENTATADPDCSGATPTHTISGNQTVNISNGTLYYVTGSFTGTINFSGTGGSINVCGTLHPVAINGMNNTCFITVTQGGTFIYDNNLVIGSGSRLTAYSNSHIHLGGLNMNGTARIINRCHDWVIDSQFSPSGSVENYGSMKLNNGLNINSDLGLFVTTDSLSINGNLNINSSVTNNGPIEINGHLYLNSGNFYNNCRLVVHEDLNLNSGSLVMNGAYLKEFGKIQINSSTALLMKNNSMISTSTYQQNADIQGTGGRSEIKITGSGQIAAANKVSGSIEMTTPTGTLVSGGSANFINGATLTKISTTQNIIPVSLCNPEGNGGVPPVTDTDGDGVANTLDKYPTDPTRAFDNYYPSQTGFGTLAFEDLWPGQGDYDLNDLVVDYRTKTVTNALNNIVDIKSDYYVRAAGSAFKNGFGFQIDGLLPGQIASVSGCSVKGSYISLASNGVENGQTKAVIIVFDDYNNVIHRQGTGSYFNTVPGTLSGSADTVKISIHLSTPLPILTVGVPPYNPFLIQNGVRGVEIHLTDRPPTSLANTSLFGTSADNSNIVAGRYYKTDKNLPWALNVPVRFDYTIEKTAIIEGYTYFPDWSQTAGLQYPDWYTSKTGYRQFQKLYEPLKK